VTPDPIAAARGKLDEARGVARVLVGSNVTLWGQYPELPPRWGHVLYATIAEADRLLAAASAERAMLANLFRTGLHSIEGGPAAAGPVCSTPCGNARCGLCGGPLTYSHRNKDENDPGNWWCPGCEAKAG
jgi:hypothetical protein